MKKSGPTPEELKKFLEQLEKDMELPRERVYQLLSDEAGMSVSGVKKWFGNPESKNWRSTPYSVWRLWKITLMGVDVAE